MMSDQKTNHTVSEQTRFSWKKRVLAMMFGLVTALMIGEVAVRLSGVNDDYRAPATSQIIPRTGGPFELAPHGSVPYSTTVTTYPSNPRGYFDADNSIAHHFNSEGWRDDEHPMQKPPGTFRILGLGDSYLFGQGVKRDDLFIERLGQLLSPANGTARIETINTGRSGYNTKLELSLLEDRGFAYDPDLVILCFIPNDVEPDLTTRKPKVEFFTEFTVSYTDGDWLSNYSELWMFVRRTIAYQRHAKSYLDRSIESYRNHSEKWQSCRASLLEIHNLCEAHEIPLLVVIFPFFINLDGDYPFQLIHDQVTSACQEAKIPVLDLRETFRGFHGPELWVHPTDQHPNERAHKLAAEAISQKIVEAGWLPSGPDLTARPQTDSPLP